MDGKVNNLGVISINANPITELLKDHPVTVASMSRQTRLCLKTCYKLMDDPTAQYNEETAEVVTRWFRDRFDANVTAEQLFHNGNLRVAGRRPLSGAPVGVKGQRSRKMVCQSCWQETPIHANLRCRVCEEPLQISAPV